MTNATITKTVFLDASRDTVWGFLTQAEKLAQWFHRADRDLEKGQDYALVKRSDDGTEAKLCWGTVLEMEPPSLLSYTFTVNPLAGAMTTVTWKLEEVHGGTMLSLTHEGIGKAAGEAAMRMLMALDAGWDEHLANLRAANASGSAE